MTTTTNNSSIYYSDSTTLAYLVKQPEKTTGKKKAIILLHGVGGNENDLSALASSLPNDYVVLLPRGKFNMGPSSYGWYHVDFSIGRPLINAEEERISRHEIMQWVREMKAKYQLEKVYIGGFSQGAIMSYSIGLTDADNIDGVIALSGRILSDVKPMVSGTKKLPRLNVFIAHGVQDNTLPLHFAKEAQQYLTELHVQLSYHEYNMGHQITDAVVTDINKWLATH